MIQAITFSFLATLLVVALYADLHWHLLARIVAWPPIRGPLIRRAQSHPYWHLEGYMDRYWLFNPFPASHASDPRNWLMRRMPSIRIHHIKRADLDRHLHDHPWDFRTIILKGFYLEQREDQAVRGRYAGSTSTLSHGQYHRICSVSTGGVWTVFITGKYRSTWGFKVGDRKVPHGEYLG